MKYSALLDNKLVQERQDDFLDDWKNDKLPENLIATDSKSGSIRKRINTED